jgi:hypothetical protein
LEGGHRGGCLNGRLELARRDTPRVDEARRTLIDQQNLTAYLAFQRVFIEPQRPVSSFIVLDQPSQAFFPRDRETGGDLDELTDTDRENIRRLYELTFQGRAAAWRRATGDRPRPRRLRRRVVRQLGRPQAKTNLTCEASTFATVRLVQRVTKGPGSRAAGIAMAFRLIESARHRWRAVNSAHLVALARAARGSRTASSSNDPTNQQAVTLTPHDTLIHRPWLFLSGRAAIPLIVICQCAVAQRVVAP